MDQANELIPTRQSLLSRIRNWADGDSWQDFFDTYWELICQTARRAGLDEAEAQDVAQETLVTVSKAIREFQYDPDRGSFKGWLRTTASWKIRARLRAKRQEQRLAEGMAASGDLPEQAEPVTGEQWDADWDARLGQAAMDRVKQKVAPKQFQIFDLAVLKHWPIERVAETFQVSRGYVYLVKHRVAARVRSELKRLEAKPAPV